MLLLRGSLGITAVIEGIRFLTEHGDSAARWSAGLLGIAGGGSLLLGLFTPFAGVVVGLGTAALAAIGFEVGLTSLFAFTISAAIGCIGPGAFSIDARLFGRHEIVIPHLPRPKHE